MVKTNHILRKIRIRELKSNFKSYLSVILIALLSVALFTGLYANYRQFNANLDYSYEQSNMGDYFVTTSGYQTKEEFNTDYSFIKELSDSVTARLYTNASVNNEESLLISYDNKNVSHKSKILEGKDGVLISEVLANKLKVKPKDTFSITVDYKFDSDIKQQISLFSKGTYDYIADNKIIIDLTVDGIMSHAEAVSKTSSASSLIYLSESSLKESILTTLKQNYGSNNDTINTIFIQTVESYISNMTLFNQFAIKSSNLDTNKVEDYFNMKENNNLLVLMNRENLPTNSGVESDRTQSLQLLFVFPIVFYLVGVLVIITTISELINKDRMAIGTMASLGISKRQIIKHYSIFALLITFIGGLLGAIIGPILIPNVMNFKYKLLYNLPKKSIFPINLVTIVCFLVLFLIALIISIISSYKIANKNAALIFRNNDNAKFKGLLLERIPFISNHLPLTIKMSLRNLKRHWTRSLMVIIGVLGCSCLLACGFGIDDTINNGLNTDLEKMPYDLHCDISSDLVIKEVNNKIECDSEELMLLSTNIVTASKSYDTSLYVLNGTNDVLNIKYDSRGATIDKKVAEELNVWIGDKISYRLNGQNYEVEISNIEELFITHGIFISKELLANESYYHPNKLYLKSNVNENELKESVSTIDGVTNVITLSEFLDMAEDSLSGIRLITLTVKVFAMILAVVVIYNLALLNFKERTRDIATLKVLGFGTADVAKTLLTEISILTCIGSLIGMILGKPLLILLLKINKINVVQYLYHINVSSYFIAFGLTFVVSIIINLFITLLTNKIQMVESLKSVE